VAVKMQLDDRVGLEAVALQQPADEPLGRAEDLLGVVVVDGDGAAEGEEPHGGGIQSSRDSAQQGLDVRGVVFYLPVREAQRGQATRKWSWSRCRSAACCAAVRW
jgi:hypothetical protein